MAQVTTLDQLLSELFRRTEELEQAGDRNSRVSEASGGVSDKTGKMDMTDVHVLLQAIVVTETNKGVAPNEVVSKLVTCLASLLGDSTDSNATKPDATADDIAQHGKNIVSSGKYKGQSYATASQDTDYVKWVFDHAMKSKNLNLVALRDYMMLIYEYVPNNHRNSSSVLIRKDSSEAVSYTHLTLPTICSV